MTPAGSNGELAGDNDRCSGSQSEGAVMSDKVFFSSLLESMRTGELGDFINRCTKADLAELPSKFEDYKDKVVEIFKALEFLRQDGVMRELGKFAQHREL